MTEISAPPVFVTGGADFYIKIWWGMILFLFLW